MNALAQTAGGAPLRIYHGYGGGSGPDVLARAIAPSLGRRLGVTTIVEQKSGGGERLVASAIARMPADGQNLYLMTGGQTVITATDASIQYDLLKNFTYITMVTQYPFFIAVPGDSRFRSLADILEEARRQPGKLSYSTSGVGSTLHLSMELLCNSVGVRMTHVPYRDQNSLSDLVGNVIDMSVGTFAALQGLLRSGRVRAVATTAGTRFPMAPDVPAVAETVPGFEVMTWMGLTAPAALPKESVDRIRTGVVDALAEEDVRRQIENSGSLIRTTTPKEFRDRVAADIERWRKVAVASNIKLQG